MANFCSNSDFQSKLHLIREDIEIKFAHVAQLLEDRKKALLLILDDILSEYEKKKNDTLEAINLLESNKNILSESLENNLLSSLMGNQVDQLNDKIAELQRECEEPNINLKWEENKVNELIDSVAVISLGEREFDITTDKSTPDYEYKRVPVLCAVRRGNQSGQICNPRGIAIDQRSGNIYVADYGANRASVFSPKFKFLFQFGVEQGPGEMGPPHGMSVFQDKVYVTSLKTDSLLVYTLEGKWICSLGSHGTQPGEFNAPGDSFVDETNKDIYICDSANHRVQIFDADFKFKSIFTQKVNDPLRGMVRDSSVIILDNSNPCLHFFTRTGELLRSIIHPVFQSRLFHFDMDSSGNVVLADVGRHCVIVTNSDGELIHEFGTRGETPENLESPWGLTLTKDGDVIVISNNVYGCLKVF